MKRTTLLLSAVAIFVFASSAFAGYDPSINPLDPGYVPISFTDIVSGFSFDGRIDYDVYAPGEFTDSASVAGFGSISQSAFINEYVYEYQVTSFSGFGNSLSIAIPALSGAANFGYVSNTGDSDPHYIYDAGDQVLYSFVVMPGQSTATLVYTSPYAPGAGNSMLSGMMAGSQGAVVPVPVPEPGTLLLLGTGCLSIRYLRKRSRKAA